MQVGQQRPKHSKDEAHVRVAVTNVAGIPLLPWLEPIGSPGAAVSRGHALQEATGQDFTWLTCTNAGAAEVCRAALALAGIGEEELSRGYPCDPDSKSPLRIIARPGIKVRLTRNLDKQRGFVNGARATTRYLA